MSVPCNSQSMFVTEEILELLPTGVVLGREMRVTSIASVTPVLAGSRPEWYLLTCPWEGDRVISLCPIEIISSLKNFTNYFNDMFTIQITFLNI